MLKLVLPVCAAGLAFLVHTGPAARQRTAIAAARAHGAAVSGALASLTAADPARVAAVRAENARVAEQITSMEAAMPPSPQAGPALTALAGLAAASGVTALRTAPAATPGITAADVAPYAVEVVEWQVRGPWTHLEVLAERFASPAYHALVPSVRRLVRDSVHQAVVMTLHVGVLGRATPAAAAPAAPVVVVAGGAAPAAPAPAAGRP